MDAPNSVFPFSMGYSVCSAIELDTRDFSGSLSLFEAVYASLTGSWRAWTSG
jgi:hypothetical protein